MLASKINLPLPGSWTKDHPTSGESTAGEDLAAGVVGETGQILDEAGKPVARITEGEPKDLVGSVVASSGEILNSSGDVVGKAVPLTKKELKKIPIQPEQKKGGVDLMGMAKTAKGAYDTFSKVPGAGNLAGQVGKGLGFGGSSKEAESEAGMEKVEEKSGEAVDSVGEPGEEPQADVGAGASQADAPQASDSQEDASQADVSTKNVGQMEEAQSIASPGEEPQANVGAGASQVDAPQASDSQEDASQADVSTKNVGQMEEAPISMEDKTQLDDTEALQEDLPEGEQPAEGEPEAPIDYSILKDCKINKAGNVISSDGHVVGRVVDGNVKDLIGRKTDENGDIWNDSGKIIGKAEPVPLEEEKEPAPFEDFPDAVVESDGTITFEGNIIGRVVEGDPKELQGKKVDEDGDILDRVGNTIGKAERTEPEPEEVVDTAILEGKTVNKVGNVVDASGDIYGRLVEGDAKRLAGRPCDKDGNVHDELGDVVGRAEPVRREESREPAPFEDFPDAVVESNGTVTFEGAIIGRVIEGDPKKLKGKTVDEDGDILDRAGNVLGKAERWEEEEPEEVVADTSILAGKRVNKIGNVVDTSGTIYGRLVEGDPKRLAGRMCNKEGNVLSESGDVIGRAEVVPEGEREGVKEGPFADLPRCTVTKEGKVVTSAGDIVGRLTEGDGKFLFGRAVDEDGDVLDKNGNVIGKAERWEEEVEEEAKNPLCGYKINREGNVVGEDGNVIGKLTSGELSICSGKVIDNDGDVVDKKGNTVGHASLLEDIPEPEETAEEKEKREKEAEDKKLAQKMATCLEQCLDKIKPICKMITEKIDKAERTPKEELDEEALVKEVKPLIEEGHKILQEANGIIRGLDPDGHIQANAKHKTAAREATPEEYHLAEVLKEITGTVTECIESAKRKIEDMPHAKKELNPLWALLTEPLGQIIAGVGLLLSGVLGLVGSLLGGLGLGGLVGNLLGGLGLTNVLKSLGLGSVVDSVTGKKK